MPLDPKDREIVEKFKALLRARGVPVKRVIVFGSRARGDHHQDSDLDVLVEVSARDDNVWQTIFDCAWEAGYDDSIIICPTVFTSYELEEGPESASVFVETVLREGIIV